MISLPIEPLGLAGLGFKFRGPRDLSSGNRCQPGRHDGRVRLRRSKEAKQRASGVRLPGCVGDRAGERKSRLKFRWNRPDVGYARNVYQLANLLEANFHLATRNDRGD